MPLIKANDPQFFGIKTKFLNTDVVFTKAGHAIVSSRVLRNIQQNFGSFVIVDPDMEDPNATDAPSESGIYSGDNLVKVKSISPPFNLPTLVDQKTSTPHGPAYFDQTGTAWVPAHIAEFFAGIPHAFRVDGHDAPIMDSAAAVGLAEKSDPANSAVKPSPPPEERTPTESEGMTASEVENAPEKTDEQESPRIEKPNDVPVYTDEREKFLRGLPPSLLKKQAQKSGVDPTGKSADEIIAECIKKTP